MGGSWRNRRRPSPLCDGRYYDAAHAFFIEDLDFWVRQTQKYGGPVLELGCGTGRIAIPLARAGLRVTGLDSQPSMLERARAKADEADVAVRWSRGDMRSLRLGTRFATVLLPFNGLCLMHTLRDTARLLARVRDHLVPNGHFILDVTNPRRVRLADANYEFDDPNGNGRVVATHRRRYDQATQMLDAEISYDFPDGTSVTEELRMRMYYPEELRALLRDNGFRVVAAHGGYDESPLNSDSKRQLLVCGCDPARTDAVRYGS